jgi:hypothetical protein
LDKCGNYWFEPEIGAALDSFVGEKLGSVGTEPSDYLLLFLRRQHRNSIRYQRSKFTKRKLIG